MKAACQKLVLDRVLTTFFQPDDVVAAISRHITDAFREANRQLNGSPSSPLLHSLLSSPHSTLPTALIYVTGSRRFFQFTKISPDTDIPGTALTGSDCVIINELSEIGRAHV